MSGITIEQALGELQTVLKEAFEGAAGGSYFIDSGKGSGIFATLAKLSAEEASRPIGGSTIAAHAAHMAFGLEASSAWIRADRAPRDWRKSWEVATVDEAQWSDLRRQMQDRYGDLKNAITGHATNDSDAMGGAVGVLAHMAYHFGAIRQKVLLLRK